MPKINLDEALPDEVRELRDDGVPSPAWYVGPLYTGNGGKEATDALDAELRGVPIAEGDEPAGSPSETVADSND